MKKYILIIFILLIASAAYASITWRGSGTITGSLTVHEVTAPAGPTGTAYVESGGDYYMESGGDYYIVAE